MRKFLFKFFDQNLLNKGITMTATKKKTDLENVAIPSDCEVFMHYRPANMRSTDTEDINKKFTDSSGIVLLDAGDENSEKSTLFKVNGTVKQFLLTPSFTMPPKNVSNAVIHCFKNIDNHEDRDCKKRRCGTEMGSKDCAKEMIRPYLVEIEKNL